MNIGCTGCGGEKRGHSCPPVVTEMQEKNVKCALGRKEDGFMREGHNDSEVESNFMQRTGMGRDWGNSIQVRKNSVCKYKGTKVER